MINMSVKTFKDLIIEVHEKGICQECGGCVSFCSSADYNVIGFKDPFLPPVYINQDKCLECGICYCICPQTHILDDDLNKLYKFSNFKEMPIGFIKNIYSCQAVDESFLLNGTDGGVVNSLINYLIEEKIVDGAIVAKTEAPFLRESMFAKSKDELLKASGAHLEIAPQLDGIEKFTTYTHTISELNHYKFYKLAVVGTPCQIYTIRCMQTLGVTPSENIEICLGLFCYENFLFDKSQIIKFEKDFNVKFEDIERINIKEDLIFNLKDGKIIRIPFNYLEDYMRKACYACSDFSNIYADISFGGLGSQEKFTTILTRTDKGQDIFSKAIDAGILKCQNLNNDKKARILDIITKMARQKLNRFENFKKKL